MDSKQISSLAKLFRDKGDKILTSESKLTLSGPLLNAMNDSFTLIADQSEICSSQSFQVVKPNNAKSDDIRNLQFIHDFVQKTVLLCITLYTGDESFEGSVDISKFRSLRQLEVKKLDIRQIVGIQQLRAQLQQLVCVRSIKCVEDIISYCGGDRCNGFLWSELKIANFSYNNLKTVDLSLEFVQCLQNLNLSHNQITSAEAIKWLPNLKVLNLSFNRMTNIPCFHIEASRRLQILIISNNFIEDINGLSHLYALTELDLSDNCLLGHSYLAPLGPLVALRYLNLLNNPLACHPTHRRSTAAYLHKNTANVRFVLDNDPLTRVEKTLTGPSLWFTSRIAHSAGDIGHRIPIRTLQMGTPSSSIGTLHSLNLDENETITNSVNSNSMSEKQRKLRTRTVKFESQNSEKGDITESPQVKEMTKELLVPNKDHLQTKKQIEDLREKYGNDWLKSQNTHYVLGGSGITRNSVGLQCDKFSFQLISEDFKREIENSSQKHSTQNISLSNMNTLTPTQTEFLAESPVKILKIGELETAQPFCEYETFWYKNIEQNQTAIRAVQQEQISINFDESYKEVDDQQIISEPEENEVTYIVSASDQIDDLILIVSNTSIKEKHIATGRTKTKWNLKTLESCDRIKSDTLRINFDTLRKDKKERIYTVREHLCQELEKFLRGILSRRPLSEMNQTIYRCIKCSTQFSRENVYKKTDFDVICPECKSNFAVEIKESSIRTDKINPALPQKQNTLPVIATSITSRPASAGEKFNFIEKSSSHSSIGSAGSLNESSSCSKLSNSESSIDSKQSIAGSSTQGRDVDFIINNRNMESDIEVLSNPSQSSIEVLDYAHSSRKTSEERKISQIPTLETIEDNSYTYPYDNLSIDNHSIIEVATNTYNIEVDSGTDSIIKNTIMPDINLTESSSSGSVTDSICTAYEQGDKNSKLTVITNDSNIDREKNSSKNDASLISSIFGGLFQSTNILMSRSQKSGGVDNNDLCEKFKYSYRDFSDVDHRLKLYFYQQIFGNTDEQFKWLVKGKIFDERTLLFYDGIIMMSTTRFHMFEIYGKEKNDIPKWLKTTENVIVNKVEKIHALPWKMGISVFIKGIGYFHILLQDNLRTESLFLYFANNPLPDHCSLEHEPSKTILKKISYVTHNEPIKMVLLPNACEISSDDFQRSFVPGAFISTDTRLYVTSSSYEWLSTEGDVNIEIEHTQLMSNLVAIDRPTRASISINFLEEFENKYELWKCGFETEDHADSCFYAIGQSWEKLFGIPLESN